MKGKGDIKRTDSRRIDFEAVHSLGTEETFFFLQSKLFSCNKKIRVNETLIFGVKKGGTRAKRVISGTNFHHVQYHKQCVQNQTLTSEF